MVDLVVRKHWIVCAFTPAPDDTDDNTNGTLGSAETTIHLTLADAQTAARTAAANTPGSYYVVYEAMWYATTDVTPVRMYRVGTIEQSV